MEQMRRGKTDTQTSDARFDEQFKLGHQMQSKVKHNYHSSVFQEFAVLQDSTASHDFLIQQLCHAFVHSLPSSGIC